MSNFKKNHLDYYLNYSYYFILKNLKNYQKIFIIFLHPFYKVIYKDFYFFEMIFK